MASEHRMGTVRGVAAVAAVAGLAAALLCGAVPQSLEERVRELRAGIDRRTADAAAVERDAATLLEWGTRLLERTAFTPHVMNSTLNRLQRPAPVPAKLRIEQEWTRILGFVEDNHGKTGAFVWTNPTDLVAGEYATLRFEYTVGDVEVPPGQGFRIGYHMASDAPRWQISNPAGEAYVSFKTTSSTAVTAPTTVEWDSPYGTAKEVSPVPGLKITSGSLKKGDRVFITVGDQSGGGRGYRIQTRDTDDYRIPLEFDFDGRGTFVPAGFVRARIVANRAAGINAVAPSVVAVGETFTLRLRVEDRYYNAAVLPGSAFVVKLDGKVVGRVEMPAGSPVASLPGLVIDRWDPLESTCRHASLSIL